MPYQRGFQVSDGVTAGETSPTTDELYATPEEMRALYGCAPTEEQLRFAQSLIHAHCNRSSLWPTEIESPMLRIPSDRQETRLDVTPVVRILEAAGRYSFGRRDRQGWNQLQYGYAAALAIAGAARPVWTPINPDLIEVDNATGGIWLPWSTLILPFNVVKCRYISGYTTIPARVKTALAEIINTVSQKGVSDRTRYAAGRVSRTYASDSFITPQARALLQPFVVQSLY